MDDLIVKLRLPSEEAADLIETRFGLTDNPRCITYRLGTLYQADGETPSDGYHVDYLLTGVSDVPQSWRKYMVAPDVPKHALAGRETDAVVAGELAPATMADLATADLSLLTPTDAEAAELAGNGRTGDLEAARTRLALRLAIVDKRPALERERAARDSAVAAIAAAQTARQAALDAISAAQVARAAAVADRDAQQAVIDNPASTAAAKRDARDARALAVDEIARRNAEIDAAQTARDDALAVIAAQQVVRDAAAAAMTTLRSELDTLRGART